MKNKKQYIDKGIYSHPQAVGYLTVKQFMLVEKEGKRCLLLRFANESDFVIDRVEFTVKQYNTAGDMIGSINIKYGDIKVAAGDMFAPKNGIVVDESCVDFFVQMIYVGSGCYKYVFKNGSVIAYYEKLQKKDKRKKEKNNSKVTVRQKYKGGGKMYGLLAFLSFVLVIGAFVYVVYDTYKPEEPEDTAIESVAGWNVYVEDPSGNNLETGAVFVPDYEYETVTKK